MSVMPRFNGRAMLNGRPWHVAEHSLLVRDLYLECCDKANVAPNPLTELHALLHDAHEVYGMGDISSPAKKYLREAETTGFDIVGELETYIDETIYQAINLPYPTREIRDTIKYHDREAFSTEYVQTMSTRFWHPDKGNYPTARIWDLQQYQDNHHGVANRWLSAVDAAIVRIRRTKITGPKRMVGADRGAYEQGLPS